MSIFSGIEHKVVSHGVDAAVEHLAKYGEASLPGIGKLTYDYESNTLDTDPNKTLLERVRKEYERYHKDE